MKSGAKKYFVLSLVSLLLLANIFFVSAVVSHSADEFLVTVGTCTTTLQKAIEDNLFTTGTTCREETLVPDPGHDMGSIWVHVDNGEMTLYDALTTGKTLYGGSLTYVSTNIPNPVHFATEIDVTIDEVTKTFQQAIIDGDFGCTSHDSYACYDGDLYWYDSCGNIEEIRTPCDYDTCIDGVCCHPDVGDFCYSGSNACVNTYGTTQCNGICIGWTPKQAGTWCGAICYYNPYYYCIDKCCSSSGGCSTSYC